jgi:hypothetical protein
MYVLCVGMYRSCSTWQYQVAVQLLELQDRVERLGFVDPEGFASHVDRGAGYAVLKWHDANEPMTRVLHEGRAVGLYSYRDLRDVVYSLMHKTGRSFAEVTEPGGLLDTCMVNHAHWSSQPGVLTQRYEDIVADPEAAVRDIAFHLRVRATKAQISDISSRSSADANRRRANAVRERLLASGVDPFRDPLAHDERSLIHHNHMRFGEIGGWKASASFEERCILAERCGEWLIETGYAADLEWTWSARALRIDLRRLRETVARLEEQMEEAARAPTRCEQAGRKGGLHWARRVRDVLRGRIRRRRLWPVESDDPGRMR